MDSEKYLVNGLLNKSRALNDGLKALLPACDIVVCTDIDILIPPNLLEYSYGTVKENYNLWVVCRNIDEKETTVMQWDKWKKLPLRMSGVGSWNAMKKDDWYKSGGFDERLLGWGGEDDVFVMRRENAGIKTIVEKNFALMHVNHPPRQNKSELKGGVVPHTRALEIGKTGLKKNWLI